MTQRRKRGRDSAIEPEIVSSGSPEGRRQMMAQAYETVFWDEAAKMALEGLCASDSFEKPGELAKFAAECADELALERRKRLRGSRR